MSDRPESKTQPANDIYTILLIVATILIAGATVYLGMRSIQLFGIWNPFTPA